MEKLLYFAVDANNMLAVPFSRLKFLNSASSATSLEISYVGDDGAIGTVNITVTSGKMKNVIQAIASLGATSAGGYVCVADSVNGSFLTGDITACAAIAISA
jgi:hypothetical protein|tara:strand:+ start:462 stop:767 length:306 start_codon:yes stop_codon:yes gene_type:complete